MTANVPTIDSGSARLGMSVADRLRRKRKMTRTTSPTARIRVSCTSRTESRTAAERPTPPPAVGRAARARVVFPARALARLPAVHAARELPETEGGAVPVGDDERAERRGVQEL